MAETLVAGALLSAFFSVLLEKMASKKVVDFFKLRKLNDEVLRKLQIRMNTVSGLLEDAEEKQITRPAVRKWLDELKDVAYNADDLLDEIAYKAREKQHLEASPKTCTDQVQKIFSSLNPCKKGIGELQPKLEKILASIEDLLLQNVHLNLETSNGPSLISPSDRVTTSLVIKSHIYGRDGDKEAIVKLLLSDDAGSTCPGFVSVVGMGGIGKTTLAQLVFNDSRVKERFDKLKVWVCVSEEVDVFKLTKNILKEIGSSHCDSMTSNQLQLELKEKVEGEKILLVMDDVWNKIDWEKLLEPLQYVAPGSRILVTTRQQGVLSEVKGVSSHQLEVLNEEDCWSLFADSAFDGHSSEADAELKELGIKIITKCKGLPLAVKTIGKLLCSKRGAVEWETILESNIWGLDGGDKIIPALKLSYHYLPSHLKQCFAYCAMFPKDFEFRKEELIFLWMAEGFILKNKYDKRELEEIGEKYFEDLCSRSFFQKHEGHDGELYFVMHDLLNDLAKSIAGEFCHNNVEDNSGNLTEKTRHLFYEVRDGCNALEDISKAECLRTFICSMKKAEYRHVVECLPRFGRLRALDLSGDSFIKEDDEGIKMSRLDSSVKHLKYMRLYRLPILDLPKTMPYLQRLIISDCQKLTSLPDSIGNMKDLRHLSLHGTGIKSLPDSIENLKNLRHLNLQATGIKSLPDSICNLKDLRHLNLQSTTIKSLPDLIGNLKNLKHLNIGWTRIESLPDSIGDLKNLRHLNIEWTGIESLPDSICNLKDLRHLNLQSTKIKSLPDLIGNLKNLKHLNLERTGIESLPDSIGDLKHLDLGITSLERLPNSVCGLHSLQHLLLHRCEQLVELPAKMSYLVNLCHLDIRGTRLKSMPPHMGKLIKLQTLSDFIVGKEEGSCIAELGHFRNLQGDLRLRDLQNVEDEQDALKAKIKDNSGLRTLEYMWENDDNNSGNVDKSLLQHLEPHVNIKEIIIRGYRGIDFPNWVGDSYFSSIVTLSLYSCKYCTCLPPLGQLASLRRLSICGFDSLVSIGAEFYGSFNSIQPFRSLKTLEFHDMPKLQEWSYENETEEGDDFTAFPLLEHLSISDCPKLGMVLSQLFSLFSIYIEGCNKISLDLHKSSSLSWFIITSVEDIESFPGMILLPPTLPSIVITNLKNLKSLDHAGLRHLTSLTRLSIEGCPNLECIPDEGLPESLAELYINKCPVLEERCRKEQGEDWSKISRIQTIKIDNIIIQSTEAIEKLPSLGT